MASGEENPDRGSIRIGGQTPSLPGEANWLRGVQTPSSLRPSPSSAPPRVLAPPAVGRILATVKWNWKRALPLLFIVLAAATRWPGVFPPNFSAFYALAFCAGAFFPRGMAWWVPLGTLLATDLILNCYYEFYLGIPAFQWFQIINYFGFAVLIALGRGFGSSRRWITLLTGGLFGACLFYLITNTAAWLFNPFGNPEYTRDLAGWLTALTKGTAGHPPTWEFFRNTWMSGGLFTGLFAGVWKLTVAPEPEPVPEEETNPEPQPVAPAEAEPAQGEARA